MYFTKKLVKQTAVYIPGNLPYCGIGATICIGREILCLPYAGFIFYFGKYLTIIRLHKVIQAYDS